MLNFVKSAYRVFFEIALWTNLILSTIAGGIIGNSAEIYNAYPVLTGGSSNGDGHPIIGGIIGLICGLLLNILGGGFVATIINIDENLEQLKNNMNKTHKNDTSSGGIENKIFPRQGNKNEYTELFNSDAVYDYNVIKETHLNDSLAASMKNIRLLPVGEGVNIINVIERNDLGGKWALVSTQSKDEGWCLFENLSERNKSM
jgi:hypothetical protein